MVMVSHSIKQLLSGECLLSPKYIGKSSLLFAVSNSDIKVNSRAAWRKWRWFLWGNNAALEKHESCFQVFLSKAKISWCSSVVMCYGLDAWWYLSLLPWCATSGCMQLLGPLHKVLVMLQYWRCNTAQKLT